MPTKIHPFLRHLILIPLSLSRPLLLQDPAAGPPVPASPSPLPAAFPRRLHEPHALRRQPPVRAARGQLSRGQRRPAGVRAARRGLGGLRGYVLGSRLQDTTVPWRLHQSLRLQLLDTKVNWTRRAKAMKGEQQTETRPLGHN